MSNAGLQSSVMLKNRMAERQSVRASVGSKDYLNSKREGDGMSRAASHIVLNNKVKKTLSKNKSSITTKATVPIGK
jgi:hypothetical protein